MSTASPFLTVDGLRLARGATEVLKGVTLSVSKGELVALMGLSGGGKTTVLRTVVGLEGFEAGSVNVDRVALSPGPAPSGATLRALRTRVGMVFQYHGLFEHLTVLDNVTLAPLHVARLAREAAEARALTLLAGLGVDRHARAFPRELSGGEAQRVSLARALANRPEVLLLDEPTASLDPTASAQVERLLVQLATETELTFVFVTHNLEQARRVGHRGLLLVDGHVVEQGPLAEILADPETDVMRLFIEGRLTGDSLSPAGKPSS